MTRADSKLHESYEHAPEPLRHLTDECWEAVRRTMIANGFRIVGDDRAEVLVAHLYEYVIQCPPVKVPEPWRTGALGNPVKPQALLDAPDPEEDSQEEQWAARERDRIAREGY